MIIERISMKIQHNTYDSHHYKLKIGVLLNADQWTLNTVQINQLRELGKKQYYDYIEIKRKSFISAKHPPLLGTVVELTSSRNTVEERLQTSKKFTVTPFNESGYPKLANLYRNFSNNRFFLDKFLEKESALEHKLSLITHYIRKNPDLSFVATDTKKDIIGFHVADLEDDALVFYEICVHPNYRTGHLAVDLLSATFSQAIQKKIRFSSVRTRVYESNRTAISFFKRLSFDNIGSTTHYYHLWCQHD